LLSPKTLVDLPWWRPNKNPDFVYGSQSSVGKTSKVPKVTEQQPLLATQRLMNSVMSPSLFFPDTFSLNAWLFLQVLVLVGEVQCQYLLVLVDHHIKSQYLLIMWVKQ